MSIFLEIMVSVGILVTVAIVSVVVLRTAEWLLDVIRHVKDIIK